MRHYRNSDEIVAALVEEHERQGFNIHTTDHGTLAVKTIEDGKLLSVNLSIIANALWEKWS
ncbi:hypothetical protein [Rhizobium sp. Leaf341]|uniref:hypothetical protein n=1 Tax=Rhizobium sp. Leaf341 TaxID=1736344 RepID=UPI00071231CC|nr:hypothetical protein [Rhizobium sp. Leaf341]KQR75766.1 hypothetical protein ASG03_19035 [Rhizobium sp. Leaf341]